MDIKIKICDRCGKIVDATNNYYMLKAIRNHQNDGEYELCKDCYTELCEVLNVHCGYQGKGKKELDKFIDEYNNKDVYKTVKLYKNGDYELLF